MDPTEKLVIVMVGLPARGKSYISHKVVGYLNWLGIAAEIFNVGKFRRTSTTENQSHDFFDAANDDAANCRHQMAMDVLQRAIQWLQEDGQVAVFDATNTTDDRRRAVLSYCAQSNISTLFLESICNDPTVLESNLNQKVLHSPDYQNMSYEAAREDLRKRITNYEKVYETIQDDTLSYIKLINLQSKVVCNCVFGRIPHLLVSYLMSIHIGNRPIYLTRPGMVERKDHPTPKYAVEGMSDALLQDHSLSLATTSNLHLNAEGKTFARKLKQLMEEQETKDQLKVYTSTLPRAVETVEHLPVGKQSFSSLNPLDTGVCHGMTVDAIQEEMSEDWKAFRKDPFRYRIPGGESFADLTQRMESFVIEMERQRGPVLIVSHLSTLQVLIGYLLGLNTRDYLRTQLSFNQVLKLTPTQYGWQRETFDLNDIRPGLES